MLSFKKIILVLLIDAILFSNFYSISVPIRTLSKVARRVVSQLFTGSTGYKAKQSLARSFSKYIRRHVSEEADKITGLYSNLESFVSRTQNSYENIGTYSLLVLANNDNFSNMTLTCCNSKGHCTNSTSDLAFEFKFDSRLYSNTYNDEILEDTFISLSSGDKFQVNCIGITYTFDRIYKEGIDNRKRRCSKTLLITGDKTHTLNGTEAVELDQELYFDLTIIGTHTLDNYYIDRTNAVKIISKGQAALYRGVFSDQYGGYNVATQEKINANIHNICPYCEEIASADCKLGRKIEKFYFYCSSDSFFGRYGDYGRMYTCMDNNKQIVSDIKDSAHTCEEYDFGSCLSEQLSTWFSIY